MVGAVPCAGGVRIPRWGGRRAAPVRSKGEQQEMAGCLPGSSCRPPGPRKEPLCVQGAQPSSRVPSAPGRGLKPQ